MDYIREIAEALSENHAALMIGAGFSKNAEKISVTDKKFLNWNELSDVFYETIYGKSKEPGKEYNSPLRLAQEVEMTVGRPKLERIIKEAVPDMEYAPSKLYVKLMEMPWKDIFTTNYDTLLERTADEIIKRRYNVVICQEDLVNSNDAPRILKLHGSFPSYRPFIITEEDYRTYPVKFAAMVNTVQQALLENVFCMMGFSCEDPNFINWVGWIHDNLGKSSSHKMYMISVSHVAEAKRKLLFERNIIVVDLQELWPDKSINDRLDLFLEGLRSGVEEKQRKVNWFNFGQFQIKFNDEFTKKTNIMKNLNDLYPGWIFLPWKMKNKVNYILRELEYISGFEKIEFKEQINYMYEYVKLLDISGRPIVFPDVERFWNILEKNRCYDLDENLRDELVYKVQEIYLHLLRAYRELAEWETYDICRERINIKYLTYDKRQFLYACDWWSIFFRFQPISLIDILDEWNLAKGDVYWPLIKASMYALLGEISKADIILADTLVLVRKQLVKDSRSEYLSSIEESIVSLINFIRQGEQKKDLEECINEEEISWWNENEKYCLYLDAEENERKSLETKDNFDLTSTYTRHIGKDNSGIFYALEYLRFLEQTGHPFRLQNVTNIKGLHGTVKRLSSYYPHWCLIQILIAQDKKHIDLMFGRTQLSCLSQREIDSLTKEYLHIFRSVMKNVKPENYFIAKSIYEHAAVVLPEIIARFCYKCSSGMLNEIFSVMYDLCMSNVRANFKGIDKIFKGLLESVSAEEQEKYFNKILELPIEMDRFSQYYDPVTYLSKPKEKYMLDSEIYNKMIFRIRQAIDTGNDEKRNSAINRLVVLTQIVILDEMDEEYLYSILEKECTIETKSLLYILNKEKYKKKAGEIFNDTMKRMKEDARTDIFAASSRIYKDLIGILKYIDISGINLEETFDIMGELVQTNIPWVQNEQPEAKERIRQSFLIAVGLLVKKISNNIISTQEKEKISKYFTELKKLFENTAAIGMIESCFIKDENTKINDIQKSIWIYDEQMICFLEDYFNVLHENHIRLKENEKIMLLANISFKISVYRIISSGISSIISSLKLCFSLLKNEVSSEFELQILIANLPKLQKETAIIKTDSEQEALYKLKCRILACRIARELYIMGIREDNIEQWKKLSESENEFVEIRNIVFDTYSLISR